MSFADEVREELSELPIKKICCKRSLTEGLLIGAVIGADKQITLRYRHEAVATMASSLIRQQYGKSPDSAMSGCCGHRYYDLQFSAPAAYKLLMQMQANADPNRYFACDGCRTAFLRGVFLASGTVNDPHKSFHLEFALPHGGPVEMLCAFLSSCGYMPRHTVRTNCEGIYFKDSGAVEDLIGMMGAQHTVFEIINSRIERDIRNNENRATNCVAKNIEKSLSAAARQIDAINRLMETGRMDALPESLRVTAMVRYRNPDATLDELVRLHEPSISKSGLNHRLKKLLEEAELP